jgi:membrane protease YdiL (CAAX protease family)
MSGQAEKPNFDLRTAAALRRMGPIGAAAAIAIIASSVLAPPLAALLVFLWAWLSRTPLADLGLSAQRGWAATVVGGIVAGVALYLLMKGVVLPRLGAPTMSAVYGHLRGDFNAFLIEVPQMIVLAGFAEEVVFRGFLINRLQAWLGHSFFSAIAIVIITAGIFGPLHYLTYGWFGAVQATIVGVLFAAAYLAIGRYLWPLVVAHATFDVAAIWVIYAGLEERVAQLGRML